MDARSSEQREKKATRRDAAWHYNERVAEAENEKHRSLELLVARSLSPAPPTPARSRLADQCREGCQLPASEIRDRG
ncbi:hypothetical protein U1Q18_049216 [Sarracenia purpurea var. burkii]